MFRCCRISEVNNDENGAKNLYLSVFISFRSVVRHKNTKLVISVYIYKNNECVIIIEMSSLD